MFTYLINTHIRCYFTNINLFQPQKSPGNRLFFYMRKLQLQEVGSMSRAAELVNGQAQTWTEAAGHKRPYCSAHSSNLPSSKLNSWLPPASCPSPTTIFPTSVNGTATVQAVQTKSLAISLDNFLPTHVQSIVKILPAVYQNISHLDRHAPRSQLLPWPKPPSSPLGQCLGFLIFASLLSLPSASALNTADTMNPLEWVRSCDWIQSALVPSLFTQRQN